jgi:hypothetical protein
MVESYDRALVLSTPVQGFGSNADSTVAESTSVDSNQQYQYLS